MVSDIRRVVIVGASLAGYRTAQQLRRAGSTDEILLIGDEPHYPYQRPPLSKGVLLGEMTPERVRLRGAIEAPFELRLDIAVDGLDTSQKAVRTEHGEWIGYDSLVIATGASPNVLGTLPPGDNIVYLRRLDDALMLRDRFDDGVRAIAVIGAGFIGAEVASSARARGIEVHLIDLETRPMSRVLGDEGSKALATLHRQSGTKLHLGATVSDLSELSRGAITLALSDGSSVAVDMVVVGIGVHPNTAWLNSSRLALTNGVVCGADGRAREVDGIFAVGDVAAWHHPRYRRTLRFEHFESAVNQAMVVAHNIAHDSSQLLDEIPFAWSDQYGHVIQFIGVSSADSLEEIRVGRLAWDGSPSVVDYRDSEGRLIGALLINASSEINETKTAIENDLVGLE
ncbi:MAG: NAD(P)/FAD-dependent oxidoreductase [Acidimicrobiales bacterium]